MKEIKAVVQPHALDRLMSALHLLPHFPGVTVSDCQGQGRGRGEGRRFLPDGEAIFFHKRCKLEIFCTDEACDEIVRTIQATAHSGNPGDGVILVVDLSRVVRIRSGEEQDEAL